MPLALYMDVHAPMAVTEALRRKGLDVLTSQDDGTATQDDEALLTRADELGRVLFSQDQDFLRIAAGWQRAGRPFAGVLFAAQQGVSLGRLADDLELLLTCCEPEELRDRVTYLPLR
jgi:predicted nuclease of predicted toxin-antitoxin system